MIKGELNIKKFSKYALIFVFGVISGTIFSIYIYKKALIGFQDIIHFELLDEIKYKGMLAEEKGDYQKARMYFEFVLETEKMRAFSHQLVEEEMDTWFFISYPILSWCYEIKIFDKYDRAQILSMIGRTYEQEGQDELAEEYYSKAAEAGGISKETARDLAWGEIYEMKRKYLFSKFEKNNEEAK